MADVKIHKGNSDISTAIADPSPNEREDPSALAGNDANLGSGSFARDLATLRGRQDSGLGRSMIYYAGLGKIPAGVEIKISCKADGTIEISNGAESEIESIEFTATAIRVRLNDGRTFEGAVTPVGDNGYFQFFLLRRGGKLHVRPQYGKYVKMKELAAPSLSELEALFKELIDSGNPEAMKRALHVNNLLSAKRISPEQAKDSFKNIKADNRIGEPAEAPVVAPPPSVPAPKADAEFDRLYKEIQGSGNPEAMKRSLRVKNVLSLDRLTPDQAKDSLKNIKAELKIGEPAEAPVVAPPPSVPAPKADAEFDRLYKEIQGSGNPEAMKRSLRVKNVLSLDRLTPDQAKDSLKNIKAELKIGVPAEAPVVTPPPSVPAPKADAEFDRLYKEIQDSGNPKAMQRALRVKNVLSLDRLTPDQAKDSLKNIKAELKIGVQVPPQPIPQRPVPSRVATTAPVIDEQALKTLQDRFDTLIINCEADIIYLLDAVKKSEEWRIAAGVSKEDKSYKAMAKQIEKLQKRALEMANKAAGEFDRISAKNTDAVPQMIEKFELFSKCAMAYLNDRDFATRSPASSLAAKYAAMQTKINAATARLEAKDALEQKAIINQEPILADYIRMREQLVILLRAYFNDGKMDEVTANGVREMYGKMSAHYSKLDETTIAFNKLNDRFATLTLATEAVCILSNVSFRTGQGNRNIDRVLTDLIALRDKKDLAAGVDKYVNQVIAWVKAKVPAPDAPLATPQPRPGDSIVSAVAPAGSRSPDEILRQLLASISGGADEKTLSSVRSALTEAVNGSDIYALYTRFGKLFDLSSVNSAEDLKKLIAEARAIDEDSVKTIEKIRTSFEKKCKQLKIKMASYDFIAQSFTLPVLCRFYLNKERIEQMAQEITISSHQYFDKAVQRLFSAIKLGDTTSFERSKKALQTTFENWKKNAEALKEYRGLDIPDKYIEDKYKVLAQLNMTPKLAKPRELPETAINVYFLTKNLGGLNGRVKDILDEFRLFLEPPSFTSGEDANAAIRSATSPKGVAAKLVLLHPGFQADAKVKQNPGEYSVVHDCCMGSDVRKGTPKDPCKFQKEVQTDEILVELVIIPYSQSVKDESTATQMIESIRAAYKDLSVQAVKITHDNF